MSNITDFQEARNRYDQVWHAGANGTPRNRKRGQVKQRVKTQREMERELEFFENIQNCTSAQFPKTIARCPYAFDWPDDAFRELFLRLLLKSCGDGGRMNYPAAEVLRFMLFRFRVAEIPATGRTADMENYHWRYISNPELEGYVEQEPRQLQKTIRFLVERKLIVKVYEAGTTRYTHYRPSNSLFQICTKITQLNDKDYVAALFGGDTVVSSDQSAHRKACSDILLKRKPQVRDLLAAFIASDAKDRHAVFCAAYDQLIVEFCPQDEPGPAAHDESNE